MKNTCPCCSNKTFDRCCGRYLEHETHAKTAEQLMRSRYTAYALGGYGEYLVTTWLGAETLGLTSEQLSQSEVAWEKLEVVDKSQQGDKAVVEFKAYHLDEANNVQVLHERSSFQRVNGHWLYVSGEIL